jgi:MFS family permease
LLGVCPFSIAFLVFINSSISFVVTDLIGVHDGEGDAVGTLGFADELLALAACPLWGVLSDRIGVRQVRLVFSVDEGFMGIEIYHCRYAQLAILSLLLR